MLLVAHVVFGLAPVLPARAVESRAGGDALTVTIVAEPWAAPFTAAELAAALRLRLPRAEVGVAEGPPHERSMRTIGVRSLHDGSGLRVERGDGDAVEFPLAGGDPARAEPAKAARRAALIIALFAEEGAPLAFPPGTDLEAIPEEPSAPRPIDRVAGPGVLPPSPSPPASASTAGAREPGSGWEVGAQLGPTIAVEDDGARSTVALTVRARRYLSPRTAVELGARLSGDFAVAVAGQSVGVADRAIFAGVAYEAGLSRRLALDLGVALQYAHPVVDIDGAGPVSRLEGPAAARLAVRTGAGLVWSPGGRLRIAIAATSAFAFREREYVDDAGQEVLGLGFMILDLTAGAGVRW